MIKPIASAKKFVVNHPMVIPVIVIAVVAVPATILQGRYLDTLDLDEN